MKTPEESRFELANILAELTPEQREEFQERVLEYLKGGQR